MSLFLLPLGEKLNLPTLDLSESGKDRKIALEEKEKKSTSHRRSVAGRSKKSSVSATNSTGKI